MVTVYKNLITGKELKDLEEVIYLISNKCYPKLFKKTSDEEYSKTVPRQCSPTFIASPFHYGAVCTLREDCVTAQWPNYLTPDKRPASLFTGKYTIPLASDRLSGRQLLLFPTTVFLKAMYYFPFKNKDHSLNMYYILCFMHLKKQQYGQNGVFLSFITVCSSMETSLHLFLLVN